MATSQDQDGEQVVPDDGAENDVRAVQAWYLRSPSPSSISMVSDAYTESIFMEPIHLSSAIAAKQIINQELKHKEVKVDTMCPMMMESAEQLLVEDLYNRVKEKIDDRSLFNTPCVLDLQRELVMDRLEAPINSVDEVWPNVFIAEKTVAVNKGRLKRMGITHILNTGHNTTVFTGPDFYTGMEIHYMGVEVDDFPDSDISKFFRPAAEFLDEALLTYRGKILVNSEMGISRSAILVAAYLMIFHHMTILEALMTIRKKRAIYPNDGFIMQLRALNETLLEEREMSDLEDGDDDKSQGSVVEAKAHSIMVEEEDVESIMGAKVHSITVEEEDTTSMMGSIMSQTGKMSVVSKQPTLIDEDEEEKIYEEWRRKQGLPPRDIPKKEPAPDMKFPEQGEVSDNNVDQRIHEWQSQNAKYQSLGLEDNESSLMGGGRYSPSELSDVSSVTSQDIRALKKHLEASGINRMNRGRSDSVSTDSTWDMWNERLQEIEKEATVKSQNKDRADHGREKDIDEESVFSEANSLYNFCKKNKHKLTPLERWKIKRIQFGFHKKDSQSSDTQNKEENGGQKEGEEQSQSDVDITAYQSWKMKHQKKIGNENKDEIVEIAKGEDTATTKRKQRRAEILERSKQTLEESQSMCGWDTESSISGSIPLSAFFPNVPSASGANDAASVLSIQSNKSRVSQSKSVSAQSQIATVPIMPAGPGDGISMASIQNWIANVVSETIAQKQNEIIMMSRASSALSTASGDVGKNVDDDKSSLFGKAGGSCLSSSVLQHRGSNSVISYNTSMSGNTELSSAKKKITQTSVPLYGLFVDDVDLKKLNQKEHEMREELSEKMSQYQKEKIATINKRSSLYKKKKAKDDEDDKQEESLSNLREQNISNRNWKKSETNSFSSYSALANATSSQLENNISKWLNGVETNGKPASQSENISERYSTRPKHQKNLDAEFNGHGFTRKVTEQDNLSESSYQSNRATSRFSASSEEEDSYSTRRSKVHEYTNFREVRPMQYVNESSAEASRIEKPELECSRPGQRHPSEDHGNADNSDTSDIGSKRKFNQSFEKFDEEEAKEENGVTENKYSTGRWSQYRKSKEEEEEDKDDDDIIAAWRRSQEEKKSRLRKNAEDD